MNFMSRNSLSSTYSLTLAVFLNTSGRKGGKIGIFPRFSAQSSAGEASWSTSFHMYHSYRLNPYERVVYLHFSVPLSRGEGDLHFCHQKHCSCFSPAIAWISNSQIHFSHINTTVSHSLMISRKN